jgi:hypothetical protein
MGPQYTKCVAAKDFTPKPEAAVFILLGLSVTSFLAAAMNPAFLWVGGALVLQALRIVADWMLNGKLICLERNHPDCACHGSQSLVCAIGEVADIEEVGEDKNLYEDIDNDYAINLLLSPQGHGRFAANPESSFDFINNYEKCKISQPAKTNLAAAEGGLQGDLLRRPPGVPDYVGYFRTFIHHQVTNEYFAWTELFGHNPGGSGPSDVKDNWTDHLAKHAWKQPKIYSLPVLHCEFEGTRIRDVLDAINAFSLGGSWCKKNFLFGFLCIVLQSILAPIALVAAIVAWADASGGSQGSALADPAAGEVKPRDFVIVKGRWAYDGGHDGYNEVHAVRTLQKVFSVPQSEAGFKEFQKQWCDRLGEIPEVVIPGVRPIGMTPEQEEVYDDQQKPENGWVLHPEVDGCEPRDEPTPPVPPIVH